MASLGSTILTDLALAEAILGDIQAFASGKPVSSTETIGANVFTVGAQILTGGPVAPYQNLSNGSVLSIFSLLIEDYAEISSGQPVQFAVKIGSTWFGLSFSYVPAK